MHIHKWEYSGKEYRRGQQYRTCEKCAKNETLHHLLHMGIEMHFYDEETVKPSYGEIKRKERIHFFMSLIYFFVGLPIIFLTQFIPYRFFIPITDKLSVDYVAFLFLGFLLFGVILYKMLWKILKNYSIPVTNEEEILRFKPLNDDRLRVSQNKAEKVLMFKLANNEISKEEYTARMARL